jgi:XTP/dITP diphosphohydrolase
MTRLLLATTNKGKIVEYRYLFQGLPLELVTPADVGINTEVEEGDISMEENARHKAAVYAGLSGLLTVADDSGLEVDALGGEPGIRSARYAGENAGDRERIAYLLSKLKGVPREKRSARFRCIIAVATPKKILQTCEGECRGIIDFEPKGDNGFGYDPIFYFPEYNKTMAELSSEIKNTISHRARAAQKACPVLQQYAEETKI